MLPFIFQEYRKKCVSLQFIITCGLSEKENRARAFFGVNRKTWTVVPPTSAIFQMKITAKTKNLYNLQCHLALLLCFACFPFVS